jgi:tryptophan halogenase
MSDNRVKSIVIVGGGTSGWMSAAALAKVLGPTYSITLVESEEIGTVGVGEATIPMIKVFNQALELDEADFIRSTKGSFKLGIEFVNWGQVGDSYIHGFGKIGQDLGLTAFYHYWLKARQLGQAEDFDHYSICTAAARANKFMPAVPDRPNSPLADLGYAYHFDAGLYAKYLRAYSEKRGVTRIEGKVKEVQQRPDDGFIDAIVLESGQRIPGQLFIDCTGFRGLLIEQTLKAGYVDWSHWLPANRAAALQCETNGPLTPYTRSTAQEAGWQWRIPLQHRVGNGYVFSNEYISEDEACAKLLSRLEGRPLMDPKVLRFTTGKRRKFWDKNVVAVGLSSGFMEPLESTSIHLIQSAIARLTNFWPREGFDQTDIDEFNAHSDFEFDKIRDFLILHYHATERTDTPFWNYVRTMDVPESLKRKLALFKSNGRVYRQAEELFAEPSWVQVMLGQRLQLACYSGMGDAIDSEAAVRHVQTVGGVIASCVRAMPTHQDFIARHCAAPMAA